MLLIQPTPEQQVHIRQTFNEDVGTRDRDLEAIKDWLRKQPHLPNTWDENRIMTFLRGCNFSLERCKKKLDMYFTMRAAIPEFFRDRDIKLPSLQELVKIAHFAALPDLTPAGMRVSLSHCLQTDFDTPDIANLFKLVLMVGDVRLEAEEVGVAGDVYILDAKVALIKHFGKVPPAVIKKFLVCVQEAYPVKLKEVHIINVTPLVEFLIKWATPLLKEKLRKRIFVHSDLESLHKYVPKEVLPEELGGEAGKIEEHMRRWLKKLEDYGPWFKQQEGVMADEKRRPGKPTTQEELFGVDGSFRQLNID